MEKEIKSEYVLGYSKDLFNRYNSKTNFLTLIKIFFKRLFRYFNLEVSINKNLKPMFDFINSYNKNKLTGIEIGVYRGECSEAVLKNMNIECYYLIDPYIAYDKFSENWYKNKKNSSLEESELIMKNKLKKFNNWKLLKDFSFNVTNKFEDNSLDFVYIDGNHSYEFVMKDLIDYYPKVRGGIIGGHDFDTQGFPEVKNAVMDWLKDKDLQLFTKDNDWWIIKGVKRLTNIE